MYSVVYEMLTESIRPWSPLDLPNEEFEELMTMADEVVPNILCGIAAAHSRAQVIVDTAVIMAKDYKPFGEHMQKLCEHVRSGY